MNKRSCRLILTYDCPKNCDGCCNKSPLFQNLSAFDWSTISNYDELLLTGGEPLLFLDELCMLCHSIKTFYRNLKIIVYTAKVKPLFKTYNYNRLFDSIDGLTVTLHEQKDLDTFIKFNKLVEKRSQNYPNKSLRLNVFTSVQMKPISLQKWNVKFIEWIKDCPLPPNEDIFVQEPIWKK